jgi:transcriptional regulator
MYVPDYFKESRPEALQALIRARPLGTLVTLSASGLEANHIPFVFASGGGPSGSLLGHVARQNPVWRGVGPDRKALSIFHGPSAYVSPSWYPAKKEHGRVVPTWNYVVVHAHGALKVHDDPVWIRRQIELLTNQMESAREAPWAVSDAPADYVEQLAQGIVGIELVIERLAGKWKASQNHPPANKAGVVAGLESSGEPSALEMAGVIRACSADPLLP